MPVITPIIHRNGDTPNTLVARLEEVWHALWKAKEALDACSPHTRNFYPTPGLFELYLVQHEERHHHVQIVIDSLEEEITHIYDQHT